MARCFIGIGTNLGNREMNIRNAINFLKKSKIKVLRESKLIETRPIGGPRQGNFLNGALEIETKLTPNKLLSALKAIENKMGRFKTVRNGPRIIDLDILLYGDKFVRTKQLTIPHPRMLQRNFVIKPLKEIAPETVKSLLSKNK